MTIVVQELCQGFISIAYKLIGPHWTQYDNQLAMLWQMIFLTFQCRFCWERSVNSSYDFPNWQHRQQLLTRNVSLGAVPLDETISLFFLIALNTRWVQWSSILMLLTLYKTPYNEQISVTILKYKLHGSNGMYSPAAHTYTERRHKEDRIWNSIYWICLLDLLFPFMQF